MYTVVWRITTHVNYTYHTSVSPSHALLPRSWTAHRTHTRTYIRAGWRARKRVRTHIHVAAADVFGRISCPGPPPPLPTARVAGQLPQRRHSANTPTGRPAAVLSPSPSLRGRCCPLYYRRLCLSSLSDAGPRRGIKNSVASPRSIIIIYIFCSQFHRVFSIIYIYI